MGSDPAWPILPRSPLFSLSAFWPPWAALIFLPPYLPAILLHCRQTNMLKLWAKINFTSLKLCTLGYFCHRDRKIIKIHFWNHQWTFVVTVSDCVHCKPLSSLFEPARETIGCYKLNLMRDSVKDQNTRMLIEMQAVKVKVKKFHWEIKTPLALY